MDDDLFTRRPWRGVARELPGMPRGMLRREEAHLLYHLARDLYRGYGEIVDAGAFLGASSYCLAKGLSENARMTSKSGRLHAFDLFGLWREEGETYEFMSQELRAAFDVDLGDDQSSLPVYFRNLGDLGPLVRVHPGDITRRPWPGRPIEILFIDICKTLDVWRHVLATFYPSLIPGVSVVVQQDWHHPLLPFIHVVHEHLSGYFDLAERRADGSAAFVLRERIPDRALEQAIAYDFTPADQIRLFDLTLERFAGDDYEIRLAKVVLMSRLGHDGEAYRLLEQATADADPHNLIMSFNLGLATAFLARNESHFLRGPEGFDEAAYLRSRPDVAKAVRSGRFVSGLHHWRLYGRLEAERAGDRRGDEGAQG